MLLFLPRYVRYRARQRWYARMEGAARLFREVRRAGAAPGPSSELVAHSGRIKFPPVDDDVVNEEVVATLSLELDRVLPLFQETGGNDIGMSH